MTPGLFSVNRLRIDLLPTVELPTVTVATGYENASPEVVERLSTGGGRCSSIARTSSGWRRCR